MLAALDRPNFFDFKPELSEVELDLDHPIVNANGANPLRVRACYLLGEGVGNTVYDLSPYENHGSLAALGSAAKPTWASSVHSKMSGMLLDHTSGNLSAADASYVSVPDSLSLDVTEGVSVEAIFRQDINGYTGYAGIAGKWGLWDAVHYPQAFVLTFDANNQLSLYCGDTAGGGTKASATGISLGNYYHAIGTYDKSNIRIFVDGAQKSSTAATYSMASTSRPLEIGVLRTDDANRYGFDGHIALVIIYEGALTAQEVMERTENPLGIFKPLSGARWFVGGAGLNLIKVINESVNLVETKVRTRAMARVKNETWELPESLVRARALVRSVAETFDISESLAKALGKVQVVNESWNVIESLASVLGKVKVVNETFNLIESLVRTRQLTRLHNESIELDESAVRSRSLVRIKDEVVSLIESLIRSRQMVRVKSETVNLSENAVRSRTIVRVKNETVNIVESLVRKLGVAATATALMRVYMDVVRGPMRVVIDKVKKHLRWWE